MAALPRCGASSTLRISLNSTTPFLAAGTPTRQPEVRFFNHNSAKSLERCLKTRERKNALVLIEGIYSLDGDEANLTEFVDICDKYDAALVCDDAHGTGTLGRGGCCARQYDEQARARGR